MQQLSDERLVAFLDGEISGEEFTFIEEAIAGSEKIRERLMLLNETTLLIRDAFDDVLHEPIPDRLLAACRAGTITADTTIPALAQPQPAMGATILPFRQKASAIEVGKEFARRTLSSKNWWMGLAAASVMGIVFGASGVYLAVGSDSGEKQVASTGNWLDNIAGYHNLFVASATGTDNTVFDVPAGAEKNSSVDIRVPDLKPWALNFQGARKLVVDGKPAYQFFYTTDKKEIGPLTIFVTTSGRADVAPTFDRRDGVNMLYWRRAGHGFAIVGQADKGWMWGLGQDIAYQLRSI